RVVERGIEVGVGGLGPADDPHGLGPAAAGYLLGHHDDGIAAVGVEGAVEQVQGAAHHPGVDDVVHRDRSPPAHHRVGVEGGVVAVGDRDLGQVLLVETELVHVALSPQRIEVGVPTAEHGVVPLRDAGCALGYGRAAGAQLPSGL